jgi:hypothetical protein
MLAPKTTTLSFEQAAAVPISGSTALQAVRKAQVQPGQKVLIVGASGGVGTFAVPIADAAQRPTDDGVAMLAVEFELTAAGDVPNSLAKAATVRIGPSPPPNLATAPNHRAERQAATVSIGLLTGHRGRGGVGAAGEQRVDLFDDDIGSIDLDVVPRVVHRDQLCR